MNKFGPRNKDEEIIFAEAKYIINIQCKVQKILNEKKIDSHILGNMLNDHGLVETLFSPDGNITIRELGRVFHVLDF